MLRFRGIQIQLCLYLVVFIFSYACIQWSSDSVALRFVETQIQWCSYTVVLRFKGAQIHLCSDSMLFRFSGAHMRSTQSWWCSGSMVLRFQWSTNSVTNLIIYFPWFKFELENFLDIYFTGHCYSLIEDD